MKFKDTHYGDLTGKTYTGTIVVTSMGLTSLEGAPKIVDGSFMCADNRLTSLEGGPQKVSGKFDCQDNSITSLKGAPKEIGGDFDCYGNNIDSLKGAPQKIGKQFYIDDTTHSHLMDEWELRTRKPKMSENDINKEMYKLTKNKIYLPDALKKIFLIKDKK